MPRDTASRARSVLVWGALGAAVGIPLALAAMSPLLQWREPIYIAAGFAGIVALALVLVQPLLIAQVLPGLSAYTSRRVHRWVGSGLIAAVIVHVAGLWITSPPDVLDALLFRSPTPFSDWGVVAMWAIFASGMMAALRPRFALRLWRLAHTMLAVIIVAGSIVHTLRIEGTMEPVSKALLCIAVAGAMLNALAAMKVWRGVRRRAG